MPTTYGTLFIGDAPGDTDEGQSYEHHERGRAR